MSWRKTKIIRRGKKAKIKMIKFYDPQSNKIMTNYNVIRKEPIAGGIFGHINIVESYFVSKKRALVIFNRLEKFKWKKKR